jgi:hypothetical protein
MEELDGGTGCLLPKMGDEGRGESACMAPQGITDRQPASQPLVVVELVHKEPSLPLEPHDHRQRELTLKPPATS